MCLEQLGHSIELNISDEGCTIFDTSAHHWQNKTYPLQLLHMYINPPLSDSKRRDLLSLKRLINKQPFCKLPNSDMILRPIFHTNSQFPSDPEVRVPFRLHQGHTASLISSNFPWQSVFAAMRDTRLNKALIDYALSRGTSNSNMLRSKFLICGIDSSKTNWSIAAKLIDR